MATQNILRETNVKALITSMTIAILIVLSRTVARLYKRQWPVTEDFFCWFGLACFLTMCGLYYSVLSQVYVMEAVSGGATPPADFTEQIVFLMGRFYAIQLLFWSTLWSVKFSLLFMFRGLILGVPVYQRIWLGIVIFTALAYAGCEISQLLTCEGGMKAYFQPGQCAGPADAKRQTASLYYSLVVDVLTDFLIMAIPIKLLWNLQIKRIEKIGVGIAFSFGICTIVAGIVRAVSLNGAAGAGVIPISWLILWACIECLTAIIVNCLPTFAIFIRRQIVNSRTGYTFGSEPKRTGYSKQGSGQNSSNPRSNGTSTRDDGLPLDDMEGRKPEKSYRQRAEVGEHWANVSSNKHGGAPRREGDNESQESIIGMEFKNGVYVTRTVDIREAP